jgi:SAM-dependent methyltransferase
MSSTFENCGFTVIAGSPRGGKTTLENAVGGEIWFCQKCGIMHYLANDVVRLNLGCGKRRMHGFVNVDKFEDPDRKVDLSVFPWPWAENSVEEIYSQAYFEHAKDFMATWREAWRILRPGGKLTLIVPHFRAPFAAWPQQHVNQFSISTFKYNLMLDDEYAGGEHLFETVRLRHLYGPKMKVLQPLANVLPLVWDWLGLPVAEILWSGVKRGGA